MAITFRRYYILLLLVITVEATDSRRNETSQEHRQSRVTGRIVKIYSGPRPEPIHCAGEGFLADPHNCAVFYRCMKSGNGRFTVFRFQCGPGTIYDPETEICNHPRSTKRSECGGISIPNENDIVKNNEIEIPPEIPSPITSKPSLAPKPTLIESFTTSSASSPIYDLTWAASSPVLSTSTKWDSLVSFMPSTLYPKEQPMSPMSSPANQAYNLFNIQSTRGPIYSDASKITSTHKPATAASTSGSRGIICTSDGFVGDYDDCRKFYRCVANNRGTYIRYEFSCSESTVWDDDTQSCNHAWAVKRSRCGRSSQNIDTAHKPSTVDTVPSRDSQDYSTIQQQLQVSYGSKVTQTQTQISNGSVIQNETQINYGDRLNENKNTEAKQNQTQISQGSAVSQTQTQIDYSDKGVQTQLQIDHSQQASQTQVQVHESTTRGASTFKDSSTTSAGNQSGNLCNRSGFMGDSSDCKKFYRCVDNGRGGYTKFEFSCGEGTVWEQSIEACNHAWAVKECGSKEPTQTTTTTSVPQSSSSSTQNYYTTTSTGNDYSSSPAPVVTEDYEDTGYGQQPVQSTASTSTTTTTMTTTTRPAPVASPSKSECQTSGFMGDPNDCKIFYRCVENGRGSFTKYEFKCGEGTVWDPDIEACNHAWAVKQCGGNTSPDKDKVETTTYKQPVFSSTQTQSTTITHTSTESTVTQNDDYDAGYGSGNNDFTTKTTTSSESPSTADQSMDNVCQATGFMGDKNDCKKFYRCVDNGNGGFIRYEFTCGEGTVWDTKIEACNHAWAVESCGGSGSTIETTTKAKPTTSYEIPTSSSTENYQEVTSSHTAGSSPSTVTESLPPGRNDCTQSGFMGDQKDCKKFYRCVDNGNGSFTKYEFSCGEGTVWDQKIEACNHAWAVKKCGGFSDTSSSSQTTPEPQPTLSDEIDNGYPSNEGTATGSTTTQKVTTSTTEDSKEPSEVCTSSGFVGDKRDCKKFYRCVDDGKGGYIRYEFSCGEGTLWDQSIEACNHAWAVKDCAGDGSDTPSSSSPPSSTQVVVTTESGDQGYPQETEKTSTSTTSTYPDNSVKDKCYQAGFMGDSNDCKKFYRCVDNGRGGFTQYQFVCGEGTYWNQEILACDHATSENACKNLDNTISSGSSPSNDEMVTEATVSQTPQSSTTENGYSTQKPQASSGTCKSEGFYADQNDCKKFYRCVDNGKGGFTKYDFTCGDGTVWDSEIQACNHETSDNKCSSSTTSSTIQSSQTEYNGSASSSTTTEMSTEKSGTSSTPSSSSSYQCTSEGFFAHPNDCKKFIRCVSNDKGGFTKYEFTCGEGTIWVQDILACDHDDGDSACSSQMSNQPPPPSSTEGVQLTTEKYQPTSLPDQSQQPTSSEMHPVMNDEENTQPTTESTTTMTSSGSNEGKPSENKDTCENEGYYGNSQDCKKFYRCVDNGKGGYTKYDFDCGEGTIWDQDVTTCNHPQNVVNPSCKQNKGGSTSPPPSSSSSTTSTSSSISDSSGTTSTTETSQSASNCSQEETSKKPEKRNFTCDKAGFYANPYDCKKFYRCVDWDGDGKRFSIYHFDCGEGTIWDPAVETCNHEESVYPPRDCSGSQSQSGNAPTDETSSTTQSSTEQTTQSSTESTSTQSTSSEQTTTQQSTTSEATTTQESTSSEQTTTEQSTTSEHTTTQQSSSSQPTTTEKSTTEQSSTQSTTESTTTQSSTELSTTESTTTQSSTEQSTTDSTTTQSTTEQSTTSSTEQSTTQQSTSEQSTTEQSTTEQSTTEQSTTEQSTTSTTEQSTTEQSSTEQSTTEQSTTEQSTTEQSTTEQSTSEQSTTEQSTTEQSTTEQSTTEQSTTEQSTTDSSTTDESTTQSSTTTEQNEQSTTSEASASQSTTESSTDSSTTEQTTGSDNKCPETDNDQNMFVCPTSFRRHPKYCNLFYQCDEDDDTHDAKIAVFTCPNNTIYDESQTRCVEESKADKKCEGQIAQKRRFKRLNKDYKEPIVVTKDSQACPSAGYFSFEKDSECSPAFLKCKTGKNKKLRGLVHQCPSGYLFWSISKRCEPINRIRDCKRSQNIWTGRWEIPVERRNVAPM